MSYYFYDFPSSSFLQHALTIIKQVNIFRSFPVQTSVWTPANLPNIATWWRADKGVTLSGSNVAQWNDQTGNSNNNLTVSTVGGATNPTAPTWSATGFNSSYPGITFTGESNNVLVSATTNSLISSANQTFWMLMTYPGPVDTAFPNIGGFNAGSPNAPPSLVFFDNAGNTPTTFCFDSSAYAKFTAAPPWTTLMTATFSGSQSQTFLANVASTAVASAGTLGGSGHLYFGTTENPSDNSASFIVAASGWCSNYVMTNTDISNLTLWCNKTFGTSLAVSPGVNVSPGTSGGLFIQKQANPTRTFISTLLGSSSVTPTTWNPSDASGSLVLSNGNKTINTQATGSVGYNVRSIFSATSGKYYYETTVDTDPSTGGDIAIGVANSTFSLTGPGPGDDANACGAGDNPNGAAGANTCTYNGVILGSTPGILVSQVIGCAFDISAKLIWFCNATTAPTVWNAGGTANPATGVGGYSFSGLTGNIFAVGDLFSAATSVKQSTTNFGSSAFVGTAPSGFGKFGTTSGGLPAGLFIQKQINLFRTFTGLATFLYTAVKQTGSTTYQQAATFIILVSENLTKQVNKIESFNSLASFSNIKAVSKNVGVFKSSAILSNIKQVGKNLTMNVGASFSKATQLGKNLTMNVAMSFFKTAQLAKSLLFSVSTAFTTSKALSKTIGLFKANTTFSAIKQVDKNLTMNIGMAFSKAQQLAKSLLFAATTSFTTSKALSKTISLKATAIFSAIRQVSKTLIMNVATTFSAVKQINMTKLFKVTAIFSYMSGNILLRTFTLIVTTSETLLKQVGKVGLFTPTVKLTTQKQLAKTETFSVVAIFSAVKQINMTKLFKATASFAVLSGRAILRVYNFTVNATETLSKQVGKNIVVTTAASFFRGTSKISKTIVSPVVVTFSTVKQLNTTKLFNVAVSFLSQRSIFKSFVFITTAKESLQRTISKTILMPVTTSLSIVRGLNKTIQMAVNAGLFVTKQINKKVFTQVVAGFTSIAAKFIHRSFSFIVNVAETVVTQVIPYVNPVRYYLRIFTSAMFNKTAPMQTTEMSRPATVGSPHSTATNNNVNSVGGSPTKTIRGS